MTLIRSILTLLRKETIAHDTIELNFKRQADFDFLAGQFIQVLVPGAHKETPRSYSISSTPSNLELQLCVKLLPNGLASTYLNGLNVNDSIAVQGPLGRFTNDTIEHPLTFVATGVGLAPIMSIIEDELQAKKNQQPIELLFGVRSEADIFWVERLDALREQFSNFKYSLTLSQPSEMWSGLRGRVTEYISKLNFQSHFFLCGSADMVREVRTQLLEREVSTKNIHLEIF